MEKKQTIGRAWRHGQKEQVFVFEIIAPGTCDETISGLASSKAVLGDYFLSGVPIGKFFDTGDSDPEDELPLFTEEELQKQAKKNGTKVRGRTSKGAKDAEAGEIQTEDAVPAERSVAKPGPSRPTKRKAADTDTLKGSKPSNGDGTGKAAPRKRMPKTLKSSEPADVVAAQAETPKAGDEPKEPDAATTVDVEMSLAPASSPAAEQASVTAESSVSTSNAIPTLLDPAPEAPVPLQATSASVDVPEEMQKGKQRAEPAPSAGELRRANVDPCQK